MLRRRNRFDVRIQEVVTRKNNPGPFLRKGPCFGCIFLLPYEVKRGLVRYSPRATTTNQPTNRAPNELSRLMCRKSIFWGRNSRFWAIHPYFIGREQSFGTNISENHQPPFTFFYWAWHQMGQKGQYLARNDFWGQILPFLGTSFALSFVRVWHMWDSVCR